MNPSFSRRYAARAASTSWVNSTPVQRTRPPSSSSHLASVTFPTTAPRYWSCCRLIFFSMMEVQAFFNSSARKTSPFLFVPTWARTNSKVGSTESSVSSAVVRCTSPTSKARPIKPLSGRLNAAFCLIGDFVGPQTNNRSLALDGASSFFEPAR